MLNLILTYKYLLIFPFAIVDGTTTSLICGFFISLGTLNFVWAYLILLSGDLFPDIFLYCVGRYSSEKNFIKKYGVKIFATANLHKTLEHLWNNHGIKTFIFTKLSYGMAIPFLISAGLIKYPVKKYSAMCLIISAIKAFIIIMIGYHLGSSYKIASHYIEYFYIVMAVIFILIIIFYFLLSKKIEKKIQALEKEEEIR